jgi:hypothetical protein
MLLTVFSPLPSSFVLVAKRNGRVRAATTVTVSTGFGLPCIKDFPAVATQPDLLHMAEISMIGVEETAHLEMAEKLYHWPLWNFALRFCRNQLKVRTIVTEQSETQARLLVLEMGLRPLARTRTTTDQGSAIDISLIGEKLSALQNKWITADARTFDKFGYTKFFLKRKYPEFLFARVPPGLRELLTIKPDDFVYFFKEKSDIAQSLPESLLCHLRSVYEDSQFTQFGRTFFPQSSAQSPRSGLRRINYRLNGVLRLGSRDHFKLTISQIAEGGFRATIDKPLPSERVKPWEVLIEMSQGKVTRLNVTTAWRRGQTIGFKILNAPREWHALVQAAAVHADDNRSQPSWQSAPKKSAG